MLDYPNDPALECTISSAILKALRDQGWIGSRPPSRPVPAAPRVVKEATQEAERSIYRGVLVYKRWGGGYFAQWQDGSALPVRKFKSGPIRRTQLEAAWDYARACGLDGPVLR
jgi:hypothetical protein